MRIRFQVDYEVSPRTKRALRIAAPVAIVLGASVAYAAVPNTFKDGDALSAQGMNDNFSSLDQRLAKMEAVVSRATQDGGYSLGATYCGATSNTPADLSALVAPGKSYAKARVQCQSTCSQAAAHMCSADELIRSEQLGLPTTAGWYTRGGNDPADSECVFWTDGTSATFQAPYWTKGPNSDYCNKSYPVLCCD